MNYITLIQRAAHDYDCPWRELPADVRQEICAAQWRETPYLEPFNDWTFQHSRYVFAEQPADAIALFRPNSTQSPEYRAAVGKLAESVMQFALAWSEKKAEDDYDAEFDKESTSRESAPCPLSDFLDIEQFNAGRV